MDSQEFRLLQQIYVLADDREHDAAKKKKLPEEKSRDRWLRSARKAFEGLLGEDGPATTLRRAAEERHPDDPKKAIAYWRKGALNEPEIKKYVARFDILKNKSKYILKRVEEAAFGVVSTRKAFKKLQSTLMSLYQQKRMQQAKEPLQERLPEAFVADMLPKTFGVDINPDGELVSEFQVFGTKKKTIETKRKAMLVLIRNWNKLAERVNADLESTDPATRLKAIIVSILMSSGIRVGEGKSKLRDSDGKVVKDENDEPVFVDTFGATSLLPEHVDFVKDNVARLDFLGKSAHRNIVDLTDDQLVAALREQIAAVAEQRNTKYLFVLPDGNRISDKMVNNYIKKIVGKDVSAHNFRHLKAVETFFATVRRQQEVLADKLRELKGLAKQEMMDKTTQLVHAHLKSALEQTQETMHHEDVSTTIESYLHPRVILEYLSNAGLERALEVVLGDGHGIVVKFDPVAFYEAVVGSPMVEAAKKQSGLAFYYGDRFVDYDIDDAIGDLEEESSEA